MELEVINVMMLFKYSKAKYKGQWNFNKRFSKKLLLETNFKMK